MIYRLLLAVMISVSCIANGWAGSGPDIQEGNWEITTKVSMPGVPMKMPPFTSVQCLKKSNPVPQNKQPGQECELQDVQVKGNTVTWSISCTNPQGKMTGQGKATYNKDKMTGSMTMQSQDMSMAFDMKGHRIGACP